MIAFSRSQRSYPSHDSPSRSALHWQLGKSPNFKLNRLYIRVYGRQTRIPGQARKARATRRNKLLRVASDREPRLSAAAAREN